MADSTQRTTLVTQLTPPTWNFVPPDLDAGDLRRLESLFASLAARPLTNETDVERWLRDESELLARIGAEQARRYVAMTRNTDDQAMQQAYLAYEQQVMPRVKVLADELDRHFLQAPGLERLDADRFGVVIRRRRTQSSIFRPANADLQRQEAELQTKQQAILGDITVEFEGRSHTLQQMGPYLESQDRDLRERAWRASLQARRQAWPQLEDIFDQLLALRQQMARNAGFDSYTPFRFLELGRFDYTAETCMELHRAVESTVVPALFELDRARVHRLGIQQLRPWDLEVDPDGRAPLRPFATEAELIALCRTLFERVDPRFAAEFDILVQEQLLDLMSRKGKAPGGYQYQLEDVRLPFIFANGVGLHHDVQTLLHEGGHAFHSILCRHHDLLAFRDYPIEFAETASMSMELLGLEHLDAVYADGDAKAAYRKHLEGVLRILTWIASIDAFQHWLYARPGHSREQRRRAWLDIRARFAPHVEWCGVEEALAMQWIGQTHLFNHAFYYVEYAIAQIAALQVWRNYRTDPNAAVAAYREALALGGSRALPELFAAARVDFDLSPGKLRALVADVMQQLRS
ncbi:MAG: M3 family oligoendopeptidase [Planctomycetota bacterium]